MTTHLARTYSWLQTSHGADKEGPLAGVPYHVMAYVGGTTDDYITATLPTGYNFFDGSTWCSEVSFGPFPVYDSHDGVITSNGYACTTSHGFSALDPFDEFGLPETACVEIRAAGVDHTYCAPLS